MGHSAKATLEFEGSDPIELLASLTNTAEGRHRFPITGADTLEIPMDSVPAAGCKLLAVYVEPLTGGGSVEVRINGSATGGAPLHPGGFLLFADPSPASGITSAELVTSGNANVRVWLLG